jgi:hypothetical protein
MFILNFSLPLLLFSKIFIAATCGEKVTRRELFVLLSPLARLSNQNQVVVLCLFDFQKFILILAGSYFFSFFFSTTISLCMTDDEISEKNFLLHDFFLPECN